MWTGRGEILRDENDGQMDAMKLSECEWKDQGPETVVVCESEWQHKCYIQTKLGQPMTWRTTKVSYQT